MELEDEQPQRAVLAGLLQNLAVEESVQQAGEGLRQHNEHGGPL